MSSDENAKRKAPATRFTQEQLDAILNIEQPAAPAAAAATDNNALDARLLAQLKSNIAQIAELEAAVEASKQEKADRERKEKEAREKQEALEREKDKANAEQLFDRNQAVMRMQEKLAAMDQRTLTPQYKDMQMALLSSRKELDQEYQKQAVTAARNMRAQEKALEKKDKELNKLASEVKQLRELLTLEDTMEQVGNKEGRAVKASRTNRAGARAERMMEPESNAGGVHPWAESIISQNFGASHGELIAINRGLMAQQDAAEERRKVSAARKTQNKGVPAKKTVGGKKPLVSAAAAAAKKKKLALLRGEVAEDPAEEEEEDEFLEDRAATMGRREAGFYPSYVGKPRNEQSMSHNPHTKDFYRHLKNVGTSTDFTTGAGVLHAGVDFGGPGGQSNYYY
jgi:hypothetical protein